MNLDFGGLIDLVATSFFGGSTQLAGLAMLLIAWVICAVICINARAPPVYSVVPMIPLSIFFTAYGVINETVSIILIIVVAAMVASEFKKVVE